MFPNHSSPSCTQLISPKANILVDNNGHACLADFSLLTIAPDKETLQTTCIQGGTIQWMSPELLDPERFGFPKSRPTKESDCYALGMVVYEVLSGQTPFFPAIPSAVIWKVLDGQRPGRPKEEEGKKFTDAMWEVLGLCWKPQPRDRARATAVLSCLEGEPPSAWSSSNANRCPRADGDDELDATSNNSSAHSPFHLNPTPDFSRGVLGLSSSWSLPSPGGTSPRPPSQLFQSRSLL